MYSPWATPLFVGKKAEKKGGKERHKSQVRGSAVLLSVPLSNLPATSSVCKGKGVKKERKTAKKKRGRKENRGLWWR